MKTAKRIITLCLASSLVFSMIGCSNSNQGSNLSNEGNSSTNGDPATVTSQFPDPSKPITFSMFADCTWLPYDTVHDGITGKWMQEQTGVTIDLTKATDSEQLNLLISSGDLPDLVMASSSSKLTNLSSSDLCWPLDELINKYTPDFKVSDVEKKLNAFVAEDGQFYMLKNEFNTAEDIKKAKNVGPNFGQLHMRQDIYEKLGSPAIKNKVDFVSLLTKVKAQYPDMVPLTINPREYSGLSQLVGFDPVMSLDENGNYIHYFSDPKYREYMKTINELFRAGFITAENFTFTSDEQTFQNVVAGKTFMITHYAGNDEQTFTGQVKPNIPEARYEQVPLMENWKQTIPVSGWAAMFITKKNKDPQTAIKMLNWAKQKDNSVSLANGVKGTDWDYDADGNVKVLERRAAAVTAGTVENDYKALNFLLSADDYITIGNGFYANATENTRKIFDDTLKRANWSNVLTLAYPKSGTDIKIKYDDLTSIEAENFAKLGTAKSEVEFNKIFDAMIVTAEKSGLKEVNENLSKNYKDASNKLGL